MHAALVHFACARPLAHVHLVDIHRLHLGQVLLREIGHRRQRTSAREVVAQKKYLESGVIFKEESQSVKIVYGRYNM